jgi:hypothetical protein
MNHTKLFLLLALPGLCAAQTWKNVALVDNACSAKVKDSPDSHTRDCALKCSDSGYAVVTSTGTLLKLDAKGNENAIAALKASSKADHLRVTVSGDLDGGTIKVKSLKF